MTTEAPPGWAWVEAAVNYLSVAPQVTTLHRLTWDHRYTAACSCGQDTDWDAETNQPLCTCEVQP